MKKLSLLKTVLLLCALIVGSGTMWANSNVNTVTTKFSATGDVTSKFTQTGDYTSTGWNLAVTWKNNAAWQNLDATKGSQIGTEKNPATSIVLTGSTIPGTITSVAVNTSGASSVNATVGVAVGGTGFTCGGNLTASLTNSAATYTFTGSKSGDVVLTWTNSSDKAIYIKSISVTYTPSGSTPSISLNSSTFNHTKAAVNNGAITVTYNNIASVNPEIVYYESDGETETTASAYDWIYADFNASNNVEYLIDANTGSTRRAYMKIHQQGSEVYSSLITITQASGIDTPTFDPDGGTFTTAQNVTISCTTDGSTIYYTTNGSDPTNSSTLYEGPVSITKSGTVLKAIAYKGEGHHSEIASATYTIRPAAPTFNPEPGSYALGTSFTLSSSPGNTIYYTLTTDNSEPGNPSSSSTQYKDPIVISSGTVKIKAVVYDANNNKGTVVSRTYYGIDSTTLPFSWTGTNETGKDDLDAQTGVVVNLGGDYAASNAPYRLKFDEEGKYVEIFTASKPGIVSFTTKLFNDANTGSKIKVQGSVDGVDFTDIDEFTISGKANATSTCTTTNAFDATHRVVRIYMSVKDQNVGVGTISIAVPEAAAPTTEDDNIYLTTSNKMAGWRSFVSSEHSYRADANTTVYRVSSSPSANKIKLESIANIKKGTPVILKTNASAELDGTFKITLTEIDDEAAVTPGDNLLKATTVVTDLSTTVYRLGFGSNNIGFYAYSNASAPAGIVYIDASDVTTPDPSRGLQMIFEDETTGIETVDINTESANGTREYYNLNGQRVANPSKGLYIVNGKKVMINK